MKRSQLIQSSPEIAYSIPYEWGQLHATEAAHAAYDMVPLTHTVEGSNLDNAPIPDGRPGMYLTLVGPQETDIQPLMPARRSKQDILLASTLSFPFSKGEIVQEITKSVEFFSQLPGSPFESPDEIRDEDGIAFSERLTQDAPQMLAHSLSDMAREATAHTVEASLAERYNRSQLRKLRIMSTGSVLTMGAVLTPQVFSEQPLHPASLGIGTVYGLYWATRTGLEMKKFVQSLPNHQAAARLAGLALGTQVGADIHASYCRRHFDEKLETE